MTTDCNLISFKAISTFTNELGDIFNSQQRSLKLYCRLISKTTLAHDKSIIKHIDAFREFCIANREAITKKDFTKLVKTKVEYSTRVFIDFESIFKKADSDTTFVIWKHLLLISALVDPAGKAKEVLKEQSSGVETNFLTNIINKVEENIDPNANPMEAVASIMKSGIFTDLIGSMNTGLQDGSLDLGKLMGAVQGMVSSLGEQSGAGAGTSANTPNPLDMINIMMGSMINNTSNSSSNSSSNSTQVPDIASMIGPLLSGLTSSSGSEGIPDIINMMASLNTEKDNNNIEQNLQLKNVKKGKSNIEYIN
jgi:hypothetical protein